MGAMYWVLLYKLALINFDAWDGSFSKLAGESEHDSLLKYKLWLRECAEPEKFLLVLSKQVSFIGRRGNNRFDYRCYSISRRGLK